MGTSSIKNILKIIKNIVDNLKSFAYILSGIVAIVGISGGWFMRNSELNTIAIQNKVDSIIEVKKDSIYFNSIINKTDSLIDVIDSLSDKLDK